MESEVAGQHFPFEIQADPAASERELITADGKSVLQSARCAALAELTDDEFAMLRLSPAQRPSISRIQARWHGGVQEARVLLVCHTVHCPGRRRYDFGRIARIDFWRSRPLEECKVRTQTTSTSRTPLKSNVHWNRLNWPLRVSGCV
jgi:hypothetical protein